MIKSYLRIFELLEPRERRNFVIMIGLIMAMGIVDVIGVASILPFLAVIANPEVIDTNPILAALKQSTGITEQSSFLLLLGIGVFVAIVLGLTVRALTFYALTRFIRMRMLSLSMRLFRRYLGKPYVWYLNRHSADLTKALMAETNDVVNGPLDGAMRLIAQGAIVFFIVGFLVLIDPLAALAAAIIIGGCYGLAFAFFQSRLVEYGKMRVIANRARFQVVQEAFGGIKDVKIRGLEEGYLRRFHTPSRNLAVQQTRVLMMAEMPRFAFEGILVGGMVLFVLWLLVAREGALESVLPLLGAYAFAGIRLFPAVQEIFRSLTKIRHGQPSLELIHGELRAVDMEPGHLDPHAPAMPLGDRLVLRGIEFTYPGTERQVLKGIDLEVPAHGVVGIAGTSGAGKSTAIDIIMGLLVPTAGRMTVDGTLIDDTNRRRWRNSIGYVPQEIFLLDASLAANIAFGVAPENIDMAAVRRAGRMAGVEGFAEALPQGYDTMVGERGTRLSGGQRQRVAIARALYGDPHVLVFDEATSSLDTVSERDVMEAVASLGRAKTIIKIAHRLSTLRDCDTIYLLEAGQIVAAGSYDTLVDSSETFQALHGAL